MSSLVGSMAREHRDRANRDINKSYWAWGRTYLNAALPTARALAPPQNVTATRSALCMTGATRQASASAGRARWGPSAMIAFPRTTGARDATVSRPFPDSGAFRLED